jgi:hypothetical protein
VNEPSELVPCFTHELNELDKGGVESCCENVARSFAMSLVVPLQPEYQNVEQSKHTHTHVFAMQCLHTVTMWVVGHSFASLGDVCLFFRETVTDGHSANRQLFIRHIYIIIYNIFIYCNWDVTRWQWLFYM